MHKDRIKQLIDSYIEAYNKFDIAEMLKCLHANIEFKNVSNGKVNMETKGLSAFSKVAERACSVFEDRCQTIKKYTITEDEAYIEVDYKCKIAKDMPNGLKAGDVLVLNGKSEFKFKDNLIVALADYS